MDEINIFDIAKKIKESKIIIFKHVENKVKYKLKQKTLFFGFNGSGKTTQYNTLTSALTFIERYDIVNQLFNYSVATKTDPEIIIINLKNNISHDIVQWQIEFDNHYLICYIHRTSNVVASVEYLIYQNKKNSSKQLIRKTDSTNFSVLGSHNLLPTYYPNKTLKYEKIMKKIEYLDKDKKFFSIDYIKNFWESNLDFLVFTKNYIKKMLNFADYAPADINLLIKKLKITKESFQKFINRFLPEFRHNYAIDINDLHFKVVAPTFVQLIKENFGVDLLKVADKNFLWDIIENTSGSIKVLQLLFTIIKIDESAVALNYCESGESKIFYPFGRLGNFFNLHTNSRRGISTRSLQTNYMRMLWRNQLVNSANYSAFNKSYIEKIKNEYESFFKEKEIIMNLARKNREKISLIQKELFEISGLANQFKFDFKNNVPHTLTNNPCTLSLGQQKMINLITYMSNVKSLSSKYSFIILDDPTDGIDLMNENNIVYLIWKLKEYYGKININKDFKIFLIIFTHDIQFLENVSKKLRIQKYNLLHRVYKDDEFILERGLSMFYSSTTEVFAYREIKISFLYSKIEKNLIPHVRIIFEWLKSVFGKLVIKEKMGSKTFLFLETCNRYSHTTNALLNNEWEKKANKDVKLFLNKLEEWLPIHFDIREILKDIYN